jgi:hypothetical protein
VNTKTSGLPAFLHIAILLILTAILVDCSPSGSGNQATGVAAPEAIEGFPSYSNGVIASVIYAVDGAIQEQEKIIQALIALPQVRKGEWEGMKETVAAFQKSWGDGVSRSD